MSPVNVRGVFSTICPLCLDGFVALDFRAAILDSWSPAQLFFFSNNTRSFFFLSLFHGIYCRLANLFLYRGK